MIPPASPAPLDGPTDPAAAAALHQLAGCAVDTFRSELDPGVLVHASRSLLDWTGLAAAGLKEEPLRILASALEAAHGNPQREFSGTELALLLGTASHVLDFDDTEPVNLIHVSTTLFPAMIAIAARTRVSGRDLLTAYVAAFEVESRIGTVLGRSLTARGWHVTGVIGRFGAATASALLLGLGQAQVATAMGIAATASSGLMAAFGTMSKPLQAGRPAADGLLAALLAQRGFTGPQGLFETANSMPEAFVGEALAISSIQSDWGNPYRITLNSFKKHASCMATHGAIDAAIKLGEKLVAQGIGLHQVDTLQARLNPLVAKVAGIPLPRSGLEAKFSVSACIAIGAVFGKATPECFTASRLSDPQYRDLHNRIELVSDPEIGEQQCSLTAIVNGRHFQASAEIARGNYRNPMSGSELRAKFDALVAPVVGGERTSRLLQDLDRGFTAIPDVGFWMAKQLPELLKGKIDEHARD